MSLEALTLIAQAITGLGAFAIAAVAFQHTRKTQRLAAINLYVGYWRELNRLRLECDRARNAQAKLANRAPTDEDDVGTLAAIYVNQALVAYYTWRFGGLPRRELDEEFRAIWAVLSSRREAISAMLHEESFPPAFVAQFEKAKPCA